VELNKEDLSKPNWLKDYLDNYESKKDLKNEHEIKATRNVTKSAKKKRKSAKMKLEKREKSNLTKNTNYFNRLHSSKHNVGADGDVEDNYENTDNLEEHKNLRDELNAMFVNKANILKLGNSGKMVKAANNSSTCLLS
jgi:hypothetical protein